MAFDEHLAARVLSIIGNDPEITEKSMFSGHSFLVSGNIACGVHASDLFVRTGSKNYGEAMGLPGARIFDLTGKPLKGWIVVDGKTLTDDAVLQSWVQRGLDFARTLPPK